MFLECSMPCSQGVWVHASVAAVSRSPACVRLLRRSLRVISIVGDLPVSCSSAGASAVARQVYLRFYPLDENEIRIRMKTVARLTREVDGKRKDATR